MSEAAEAVDAGVETSEGAAAAEQPQATEGTEGQSPFGDQVEALRQRLDALEGGQQETAETVPDDASFYDLLSGDGAEAEEGTDYEEGDGAVGEAQAEAGDDDFLTELDAYVEEKLQERIAPVLDSFQRDRQERELRELAQRYPDLKEPKTLDAIGKVLGGLADSQQNPSLRTDPKLVELAYKAFKADQSAASESPATQGTGNPLEVGAASRPDPGESQEEAITKAVLGAGAADDSARGVLY